MEQALIIILSSSIVPILVWVLLMIARRVMKDNSIEIKARRIDLFESDAIRMEVYILNKGKYPFIYKDLNLVLVRNKQVFEYSSLATIPMFEHHSSEDRIEKNINNDYEVEITDRGETTIIYSYSLLNKQKKNKGDKVYLRYFDFKGKARYAYFDEDGSYEQLLVFKKKRWIPQK